MNTIGERLHAAAGKLAYLQKDKDSTQGYSYVSEAAVKAAVNKVLGEVGLYISGIYYQPHEFHMGQAEKNGKQQHWCSATVSCTVYISAVGLPDKEVSFMGLGQALDRGDIKTTMKAEAAALKYALTSAFLIATGDDPEADPEVESAPPPNAKPTVGSLMDWITTAPDLGALELAKQKIVDAIKNGLDDAEATRLKSAFSTRKTELTKGTK